jgi:hypothetical protein
MTTHLSLQRPLLPTAQVSALTTGSITLPSARGAFVPPGNYYSIASTTGASGAITFSNIPTTYKHLELRMSLRDTSGTTGIAEWYVTFNGNTTGANYWKNRFYGNGASITSQDASVSSEGIWGTHYPRNGSVLTGSAILYVNDYSDTTKWKTITAWGGGGVDASSAVAGGVSFGTFQSTAAITSLTISPNQGGFVSSNTFALYGISG